MTSLRFLRPLLLLLAPAALCAAEAPPAPAADAKKPEAPAPAARPADPDGGKLSVTQHSIVIGGKAIKYTATCGYLVLKEEAEKGPPHGGEKPAGPPEPSKDGLKPKARIFFTAYTLDGADPATRPIAYAFNGGPGAASVWLHLGGLGPRRVVLDETGAGAPPPYRLADNEWSSLAQTDLVFIDPVSTGYSRPATGEDPRGFHGYEEDLHSVAEFIRLYTTDYGRWPSPKLLIGESYGGTRAAALAGLLQDHFDLYLNGIVIVSGVMNWQGIDFRDTNALAFVFAMPTYAATAWFHHRLSAELQAKSAAEIRTLAEQFAEHDLLPALVKGNALPPGERQAVAERLSALIGVPAETLHRFHLRLPAGVFMDELLKSDRRSVGRFDSRLTGPADAADGADYDPSFTTMRGNFTASIHTYLRSELKFETELPYQSLANVSPWNYANFENHYLDVSEPLAKAIAKNRYLKVWVITGSYDLAVPYAATQYALRQMYLDPSLEGNIEMTNLESGHMFYTQDAPLRQFAGQFEQFIKRCIH
jgi:carboxypeptidase C (cathepsin A)